MLKEFTLDMSNKTYHWELHPHVNILGGANGSGKSKLLELISDNVREICYGDDPFDNFTCIMPSIPRHVILIKEQPTFKHLTELMFKFKVASWMTPLDMLLTQEMITYNLNSSPQPELNKVIQELIPDSTPNMSAHVISDSMFMMRTPSMLNPIRIPSLSTGQKQLLYILLTVANTEGEPTLLLVDCADTYLHIDVQEKLLKSILTLNPNIQIIWATHSPSMLAGFMSTVREINQLIINTDEDISPNLTN